MNKGLKGLIIAGSILLGVGLTIGVVGFATGGFTFDGFMVKTVDVEKEISESFTKLSIDDNVSKINVVQSSDGKCKIEFCEDVKEPHSVEVKDDTLKVTVNENWFHFMNFGRDKISMTVYLPSTTYSNFDIECNTGKITVAKEFTVESAKVRTNTSEINWYASVNNKLEISTDTGAVNIENITPESLKVESTTGGINIKNVNVTNNIEFRATTGTTKFVDVTAKNLIGECSTGSVSLVRTVLEDKLKVRVSTGAINLDHSDAKDIDLQTSTGSISGTLLTGKTFNASSSTGRVTVPSNDASGGTAVLHTSTGSINIQIA